MSLNARNGPPCEDYEFQVTELVDGTLAPEKARVVSLHVAGCARCRRWRDEYAAMDARLALAFPLQRLPADFEWRLAARIRERAQRERADDRAAAEREYADVMADLRQRLRAMTLSGIATAVAAAGCVLAVLPTLIERARPALEGEPGDLLARLAILGMTVAAIAWSFGNGVLPGLRLSR